MICRRATGSPTSSPSSRLWLARFFLGWAALDWNIPAHDFYAKLGARRMDDWTI